MALTSTAPVIDEYGISAPTFAEILEYLKDQYRGIYGNDVYLENDSQDGQFLGILARCISDSNAIAIEVYNSFSPANAVGESLSRNVRINGISRAIATNSTATVRLIGQAGTQINNGKVADVYGNQWLLPTTVTIGQTGQLTVTATAAVLGSIIAPANTINKIQTPTRGWQSVNNDSAATPGAPLETDAALRQRQALSVAIPSRSLMDGLIGAIYSLSGVTRCKAYENATATPDGNGIPGYSIAIVVSGGDSTLIAQAIAAKKTQGCGLHGNTTVAINDAQGYPVNIKFWRPVQVDFTVQINLRAKVNYNDATSVRIKNAMADYFSQLDIGDLIAVNKLYVPASLYGDLDSRSYEITSMTVNANGVAVGAEYTLGFNQIAVCLPDNISISVG